MLAKLPHYAVCMVHIDNNISFILGIPIYHEIQLKAEDTEKNTRDLSDNAVTIEEHII